MQTTPQTIKQIVRISSKNTLNFVVNLMLAPLKFGDLGCSSTCDTALFLDPAVNELV